MNTMIQFIPNMAYMGRVVSENNNMLNNSLLKTSVNAT